MPIRAQALLLASAVLALLWWSFPTAAPKLTPLAAPVVDDAGPASLQRSSLPAMPTRQVHAISVANLASAELLALWYGGSREGGRDVALYQSSYREGAWDNPELAFSQQQLQRGLQRNLKTLGNPVLFQHPQSGRLWLFFVSTSYGGWAGSAVNYVYKDLGADFWSRPQRLLTAPILNLSTLVKYQPIALADGGLLLPSYHELIGKYSEVIHLSADGRVLNKSRISFARDAIQPSLHFDGRSLLALMRNSSEERCCKLWSASSVAWRLNFSAPALEPVLNPDSAAHALSLTPRQLLLAYNDDLQGRGQLSLKRYRLDSSGWGDSFALEDNRRERFSYPWLLRAADGSVHLFYTHNREGFAHLRFNRAWIDANL